jgi:DNA-binding transcriptional MerR regulator
MLRRVEAGVSQEELDIDVPDKLFFRIGEAAQLIGVEPHVLRYWESEFKMRPQRSSSGQRMYRRKDISRFLRIRQLLHKEGFTIAGARKALSAPAETAPADSSRLSEALKRIEGVRKHISALRSKFEHVVVAPPKSDG